MTRRRLAVVLPVLLAAAALVFFGTQVLAVAGDVRAHDLKREPGSSTAERLATGLLGVKGQFAFRRAVRLIVETRGSSGTAIRRRAQAETMLERLAARGPAARRSRAANLLGDLQLVDGLVDRANILRYIEEAKNSFTEAVRLDPSNRDAKYNLELLLTLLPRSRGGPQAQGRPGQAGRPGNAGYSAPGRGY